MKTILTIILLLVTAGCAIHQVTPNYGVNTGRIYLWSRRCILAGWVGHNAYKCPDYKTYFIVTKDSVSPSAKELEMTPEFKRAASVTDWQSKRFTYKGIIYSVYNIEDVVAQIHNLKVHNQEMAAYKKLAQENKDFIAEQKSQDAKADAYYNQATVKAGLYIYIIQHQTGSKYAAVNYAFCNNKYIKYLALESDAMKLDPIEDPYYQPGLKHHHLSLTAISNLIANGGQVYLENATLVNLSDGTATCRANLYVRDGDTGEVRVTSHTYTVGLQPPKEGLHNSTKW